MMAAAGLQAAATATTTTTAAAAAAAAATYPAAHHHHPPHPPHNIISNSTSNFNSNSNSKSIVLFRSRRLRRGQVERIFVPSVKWGGSGRSWDLVAFGNGRPQPQPQPRRGVRAMAQIAEATTAGLRAMDEDSSVATESHSRSFEGVSSEQELMLAIAKEVDSGRLPPRAGAGMEELYSNYRDAVLSSGVENAMEVAVQVMSTVLDRILLQFEDSFTFPPYHQKMMDPYNYYMFGQNYVRPLLNFRNSYLGNMDVLDQMEKHLKEGHNVILLSNHQTEADPAVMALLLEHTHPYLAENLTYMAGDRVVLDPFCKPFSMGRNLLCVYSKKHIFDVPEEAESKQKANARTLREMTLLLRKGGQLLWIAPSGGRDRPDPITTEWVPASFDPAAVETVRRLSEVVRVPAHIHPAALLCFEIMPPPVQVEKELGERRAVGYSGVGLGISEELDFEAIAKESNNVGNVRDVYSQCAWEEVNAMYNVLKDAIYSGRGCEASTSSLRLSQPWIEGHT